MKNRTQTKVVNIGNVAIGGYNEIAIQTMTTCKTSDINETIKQINTFHKLGSDLVRVSVLDKDDAKALKQIVAKATCPVIADIHYNWQFAIDAIKAGVAKIRINPGNIGSKENVLKIIKEAMLAGTAIRIGINSGSFKLDPTGSAAVQLADCAKQWIKFFKKNKFENLVVSIKDSNPNITYKANLLLASFCKYPIHIGVTEAGGSDQAIVKSLIGLIPLLEKGIGNTIRISINGDRAKEIKVARTLLSSMGFNHPYYNLVACPLCGRNMYNTNKWVEEIDEYLSSKPKNIKVGIMGCVVNGPGEAQGCDIAVCVKDKQVSSLYVGGKFIKEIKHADVVKTIKELIDRYNK